MKYFQETIWRPLGNEFQVTRNIDSDELEVEWKGIFDTEEEWVKTA